jgi:hypothetical protein
LFLEIKKKEKLRKMIYEFLFLLLIMIGVIIPKDKIGKTNSNPGIDSKSGPVPLSSVVVVGSGAGSSVRS